MPHAQPPCVRLSASPYLPCMMAAIMAAALLLLSAALHADAPWFAEVTTHIMMQLRRQISEGKVGLRLHPILLVGPFGNGKSQ